MKLLLDKCIDRRLARDLIEHEVKTAPQMGWAGIKNGELLALAETEFDVLITIRGQNQPRTYHRLGWFLFLRSRCSLSGTLTIIPLNSGF